MTSPVVSVPVATVWTGPDAPRAADAPAVADRPDLAAWTGSMDAASRLELHGRTLTQALLGEPAIVVEERRGWARVLLPWQPSGRDPRGYPGWLPAAQLGPAPETAAESVVVAAPTVECRTAGGSSSLSYGTILPVLAATAETTTVGLPAGGTGRLASAAVRVPGVDPEAASWGASLLDSARQFLGMRYLWGGTCGWGLDCSGFVHLVHRVHGLRVPRDALDQMPSAQPTSRDAAEPGDLYFFARPGERPYHVGFVTRPARPDEAAMLHAPENTELIEEAPLTSRRRRMLVGAGRFVPDGTA